MFGLNNQSQEKCLYVKRVRILRVRYMNAKNDFNQLYLFMSLFNGLTDVVHGAPKPINIVSTLGVLRRLLQGRADLFSVFGDFN